MRFTKKMLLTGLIILLTVGLNFALHRHLRRDYSEIRQFDVLETLPTAQVAKLLWLELDSVAADYYYLKAIQHFGTRKYMKMKHPHPLLAAILELSTDMDPYFARPYTFGGLSLTLMGMDFSLASKLLFKGHKYLPDNYKIAYLLGFNLFNFEHRYKEAAEVLSVAARSPEAPEYLAPLATRLAAQGGSPEIGLALIEEIIPTIDDERLKESYMERRNLLLLEIGLNQLDEAVKQYQLSQGRLPESLAALVEGGILTAIPDEPFGGSYILQEDGKVSSSTHKERLRIRQVGDGDSDE